MKNRSQLLPGALGVLLSAAFLFSLSIPVRALEPPSDEDFEVLTRGPVHEAFAESVTFEPEPGMIVSAAPPELIEELPPEVRPEGDNVTWIPGYWGWNDEAGDFLWISGVWRNLPPGREWVPGYWNELGTDEWQWVSGYWADASAEVEEVEYLSSAPPASIDSGPTVEAPSEDYSWIPGTWLWADTRYVWRTGYWSPLRTGWTWVPARYCWTPRGYLFIDGYWDYAVDRRGVLFAPVHFRRSVWSYPNYYYRPSVVVGLGVFGSHLFYRPRTCHYYFGDYYAPRYWDSGYRSAFAWHVQRGCYDPIYAYQRWSHRGERDWERRHRDRFAYLRSHADARPPGTWAAMRQLRTASGAIASERVFASTLGEYTDLNRTGRRFERLDPARQQRIVAQRRELREFSQRRRNLETVRFVGPEQSPTVVRRERRTASPIAGRAVAQVERAQRPPQRLEANAATMRRNAAERLRSAAARQQANPARTRAAAAGQGTSRPDRSSAARSSASTAQAARAQQAERARASQQQSGRSQAASQQQARAQQAERARASQSSGRSRAASQQQARAQQAERARASQSSGRSRAASQQQARVQQAERARASQQQSARSRAASQQQSRAQQAERARASQQQSERSRAASQQQARAQQAERARASQSSARSQAASQERARAQQAERARASQQQQARAAQQQRARATQQQQARAAQQQRARATQQQQARAAQQQQARAAQQQRARAAQQQQARASQQQQARAAQQQRARATQQQQARAAQQQRSRVQQQSQSRFQQPQRSRSAGGSGSNDPRGRGRGR